MWYNVKERLPKRDKNHPDASINVIVLDDKDENYIAYYVYKKDEWWLFGQDGCGERLTVKVEFWCYIPEIQITKSLPVIDGE